jgi:hypothetical protein
LNKKRLLLLFFGFLVLALLAAPPALRGMARFLAPQGEGTAEAVVMEGFQTAQDGMMEAALALVREGRARQIILVLHHYPQNERLFAIQEHYPDRLGEELERRGLKKGEYRIWMVPINDHPMTLTEARSVVPRLSQAGIRRAFLLCRGFHTRRSLLTYQTQGDPLGIRFIPYPYFPSYDQTSWWQHTEGIKEFGSQTFKLAYYLSKGYIPFTSLFRGNMAGSP